MLCVGYLGELIEDEIGAERFGIRIVYSYDGPGLDGTLGAIRRAAPLLRERFLVLYGDTYLRLDYQRRRGAWERSGLPALMTVLRNDGRWDTSNVDLRGRARGRLRQGPPDPGDAAGSTTGSGGSNAARSTSWEGMKLDLSTLYHRLAESGQLYGYEALNRFYEIGTPSALGETDEFLRGATSG